MLLLLLLLLVLVGFIRFAWYARRLKDILPTDIAQDDIRSLAPMFRAEQLLRLLFGDVAKELGQYEIPYRGRSLLRNITLSEYVKQHRLNADLVIAET